MGDARQEGLMNTVISYSLWVAIVDLFLHIVQVAQYHCNVLYKLRILQTTTNNDNINTVQVAINTINLNI